MYNNLVPKKIEKFNCNICNYHTSRKSQYDRHVLTAKHKNKGKYNNLVPKGSTPECFVCKCGKTYPYKASLYNHSKKCNFIEKDNLENQIIEYSDIQTINDNTIVELINQNKELILENKEIRSLLLNQQNQISELIPKVGNNNTVNHKQKFNINVFLNEQCKDAITMNKFIEGIKVTLEDLFLTKNMGITEGISNIFIKNMNKLSLYERPIHCTDVKRETVYIKSEAEDGGDTQWEKDKEKDKLKKAIDDMTYIQSKNLKLYTDENPDWMDKEDKQSEYMLMVKNCLDDIKDNNKEDKVIRKLCNNIYLKNDDFQ